MTEKQTSLDFNDAGEQRSFDLIPAGTVCTLQLTIRPGGAGDGGWLRRAKDGGSEGLACEFTVVDAEYAKRKLWQLFTLHGTTPGHAEAGEISRNTVRAILESARNIRPDDKSEAAQNARKLSGWADLDQIRFIARLGVRPAEGQYAAKNTISEVVTPERRDWKQPEQISVSQPQQTKQPTQSPANAVSRPQWAGG
jgi:hypothetical protein